ncbi:MAG TPA: 16S rRNA (guanine(966)-N(2))-methyltransferase RsmD [Candidatus Polarisedimenticolia bacterium]|nr:16S rRNA (guanine(966)-N(2))-methyltransferase RsmD [Candidatus Polarisedimenticolia bacterium]
MGNLRIIGGERRGFPLASPRDSELRPTSNRVREALFDILGPAIVGGRVLDLFAGTGAVGLEALSRGAAACLFIESAPIAAALIRTNLKSCRFEDRGELRSGSLPEALDVLEHRPDFDFVFLDPPYGGGDLGFAVLERLGSGKLVAPEGRVAFEHRKSHEIPSEFGRLRHRRTARYGDSEISFFTVFEPRS